MKTISNMMYVRFKCIQKCKVFPDIWLKLLQTKVPTGHLFLAHMKSSQLLGKVMLHPVVQGPRHWKSVSAIWDFQSDPRH